MDEYNAVRMKLTAEMADSANLVKAGSFGMFPDRIGGSWWWLFIFGIGFRKKIKFMKENVSRIFAETFAQEDWKTCDYELGKEGVDFF